MKIRCFVVELIHADRMTDGRMERFYYMHSRDAISLQNETEEQF
jgi:hypothetical protein